VIVHGDHLGAVTDGNRQGRSAQSRELLAKQGFIAKEDDAGAVISHRINCARNLGPGRRVAAHGVDGNDRCHDLLLSAYLLSPAVFSGLDLALGWTTTRPSLAGPYHPQDSHTRWGIFAAEQLGQVLAAGTATFIHCERRMSRRALDCLLLGTAIAKSLQVGLQFDVL
jgi:hypothetical protein